MAAWTRYLLLFQIGVVYIYAGIAKLNIDWLQGRPMDRWMAQRGGLPVIGVIYSQEWLPLFMSWGGALFDLLIVPAMLWRPTRRYAFGVALLFHLANVATFGIATFPWFSIMATALFFPPRSFRRLPLLNGLLPPFRVEEYMSPPLPRRRLAAVALGLYALVQILLPTRQLLYPEPTAWSEAGHDFSWRMMLRSKWGSLAYQVLDPASGTVTLEHPRRYVTYHQYRDMLGRPDMILQFAHFLVDEYERRGVERVEVRALCRVSLNGRPLYSFIDPEVDLAKERRRLGPYPWVMSLPRDAAHPSPE